jgi:3-mercaptopyruvate sulfurtransferase SseA
MKTGVIIYVVGIEGADDPTDFEEVARRLDIRADRVEVVASQDPNFDIMYAWWLLVVNGMKRIVCMLAEVGNHSGLKLTGRELLLC